MNKKDRLFFIVSIMAIVAAIVLVLLVFYWMFFPYKPVVFEDKPFKVERDVYRRGEIMTYITKYCKSFHGTTIFTRSFVNGFRYTQPTIQTDRPVGCGTLSVGVQVPGELPPGTYHLENIYTYKVNPIRTVSVVHSTETFVVTE